MQLIALIGILTCISSGAAAHSGGLPVQPDALWQFWTLDIYVVAPLLAMHWLYGRGLLRLWAKAGHGRGITRGNVGAFLAGEAVLAIALISPLDALGETLFSAHMTQHALLVTLAPALLIVGRPWVAMAFAVPTRRRRQIARSMRFRTLYSVLRSVARPLPAAVLHGLTIWLWHAPVLFEAALQNPFVHWLEHVSFFVTAMLLWRVLLSTAQPGLALAAALATLIHTGMLGAILTLSPRSFYGFYGDRPLLWDMSLIEDQQLAGVLMWLPMCVAYIGVGCAAAARLANGGTLPERTHLHHVRGMEA